MDNANGGMRFAFPAYGLAYLGKAPEETGRGFTASTTVRLEP